MTRRDMRIHVFKEIYSSMFFGVEEAEKQFELYLEEEHILEAKQELLDKALAIASKTEEIDNKINEVSIGWNTGRMSKVDLAILRVAIFEMYYDESVPEKVAINEAVELAKSYGGDDSPTFINGILGKLSRQKGEAK